MPCDIGYKVVARIKAPVPQVQKFKETVRPIKIDQDLLDKIGEDDPTFLAWLTDLDINPLLQEALNRAILKVKDAAGLSVSVTKDGELVVEGSFETAKEKSKLETASAALALQFQMEVLKIVAQLLDYHHIAITKEVSGNNTTLVLEGEKDEETGVHKYFKVTQDSNGEGQLVFEHFESKEQLDVEELKFRGLAEKFGIKIAVGEAERRGQPIPQGTVHQGFLKETK